MTESTAPVVRDRRKFLGGSDAAAVMGLSPWRTPVELWMFKTGRTPESAPDPARKRILDRGHRLEPFIREMTIDRLEQLGVRAELVGVNKLYSDAEHDFLACEIDFELKLWGTLDINGVAWEFDGEHINVDAKSASGFAAKKWGEEFTEDVPIEYAAQFMHGLMITGRRLCMAAALRSFDDVDLYWTVRDDETIAAIRTREVEFWRDCVLADKAPDALTFSDVYKLFPKDDGQGVEADDAIIDAVNQLISVKASLKSFEEEEEVLQKQIADFIRPRSELRIGATPIITWKTQGQSRVDNDVLKELVLYAKDDETGHYIPVNAYDLAVRENEIRVMRIPAKGKKLLAARAHDQANETTI